ELPSGLKYLGSNILKESGVTELTIPASVESYAYDPLEGSHVEELTFESGTSELVDYVCRGAGQLVSVSIPDTVTRIGNNAFTDCQALQQIQIPDSVTEIGDYAFRRSGLQSLTLPSGLTVSGYHLLEDNTGVKELVIPASLTTVTSSPYLSDRGMLNRSAVERVTFSTGTTTILQVCTNDTALNQVILPEGVTLIGDSAFYGCSALTNVILPYGIQEIGERAFTGSGLLPQLYLSRESVVVQVGESVSMKAYRLPESTRIAQNEWEVSRDGLLTLENSVLTAVEPGGAFLTIRSSELSATVPVIVKSAASFELPAALTVIEAEAFEGVPVVQLRIPGQTVRIGANAFCGSSLKVVMMPDSVTEIGENAFAECEGLGFICESDNAAAAWAAAHQIPCAIGE
ncbi:MAG: leucine-rich repeat domain-containing protein, partial [Clostridia bacterium]|nr:leucine-rich repeat domain-containing protein [Clostridia bacterium]